MPPPVQSVTNDVETRLRAAVVEARLRKAVESAKGQGASSAPRNIGPPRIDSNRERITGRADPYEPTVNIPHEELSTPWRPGRETAFFGNAGNALTLGNLDRIGALPALMPGGETYDEARTRARNTLSMAREEHPVSSLGGDVAGFLGPGVVAAKAVNALARPAVMAAQRISPTLGFGAKVTNAAAQGAAGAAAYGATVGAENKAADEGRLDPTLGERGQLAKDYAPMGAAFGAGLQAAAPVLRPLGRAASGAVAYAGEKLGLTPGSIQRNAAKVGRDAALRSLERAGIVTVEDFLKRAAKYGDKPVVTGELGQDPLNSLVSLVRSKGTTGDKAQAVLEDRIAGLPGRLLKDLADETGISPEEIYGSIDDLVKSSRAAAAPKYEAAEAAPFAETANLERIVRDSPILRKFMPTAVNRVQHQAVPQVGQADQMPPLKVYDELKQLVDEEINRRIAKGEGIEDIEGVRKALVAELDLISGQAATGAEAPAAGASLYAQAREAGGDAPRIASAFRTGEAMMGGRFNAAQVEREIAQLTGTPLTAAQQGVVRNIVTQVERGNLTPKRVKTVEFRKKLEAVFGKPAADGIIRKFGTEAELQQKGARWNPNVGSVTSQAQMGGPSRLGDEIVKGAANALTGNKIGLATQAINMLRRQGYSENQLNALGDIFLSSPDDAAKLLFPGRTPRPGSVPPPVPPAGQRRTNLPPPIGPQGPPTAPRVSAPQPTPQTPARGGAEAARLQRAREQGFDTETPLFHGTERNNIEAFETSASRESGEVFLTDNPKIASTFAGRFGRSPEGANVMPLYARGKFLDVEGNGKSIRKVESAARLPDMKPGESVRDYAKRKGYDGIRFLNVEDDAAATSQGTSNVYAIFDPKNVRGRFDDFAPENVSSSKLINQPVPKPAPPPSPREAGPPPAAKPQGPPRNALRDEPRGRTRLNTRSSIRDAPKEYRDVVMNAPEGVAQSVWDSVRKSTGNRLPSPNALQYRVREIELKGNPTAAELRELKALKEMKRRLEKLNLKYD